QHRKGAELTPLTGANLSGRVAAPAIDAFGSKCGGMRLTRGNATRVVESDDRRRCEAIQGVVEPELPVPVPAPCVNLAAFAERERKVHARSNALHTFRHVDVQRCRRVRDVLAADLAVMVAAPRQ